MKSFYYIQGSWKIEVYGEKAFLAKRFGYESNHQKMSLCWGETLKELRDRFIAKSNRNRKKKRCR